MKTITKKDRRPTKGFWIEIYTSTIISVFLLILVGCASPSNSPRKEIVSDDNAPPPPPPDEVMEIKGATGQTSNNMHDENGIYTVVEVMPSYVGGDEARLKFLKDNIKYPSEAKESAIQGTVYVTFVVDETGKISDVKTLRGIGGGCEEEAIRVVKMMPKWIPGEQSGKKVKVQFNMPIKFIL
jgi:TonB family protein